MINSHTVKQKEKKKKIFLYPFEKKKKKRTWNLQKKMAQDWRSVATGMDGVTETREVATSPISAAGNINAPPDEIISLGPMMDSLQLLGGVKNAQNKS
ncbi:hypothetical protein Phum_PHUM421020 [Pediculus humanus corporis]|uniref:Uncharacterized protein n=1 Tax=Pediculus humanus subsp. corporis TaxID=121224 RepID=E0VSP0_PEDHC|nr:uncharacterized protein Phum_PHUM421020 [Pediculus humanus corporis]EEB16396.1 hypothetical protein Phum_PHUM421020 [Pediculus humanus corporis]